MAKQEKVPSTVCCTGAQIGSHSLTSRRGSCAFLAMYQTKVVTAQLSHGKAKCIIIQIALIECI